MSTTNSYESVKLKIESHDLILLKKGHEKSNSDLFEYLEASDYNICGIVIGSKILVPYNYGARLITFEQAFKLYDRVAWCPIIPHNSADVQKLIDNIGPSGDKYHFNDGTKIVRQILEALELIPPLVSFHELSQLNSLRPKVAGPGLTLKA